MSGDEHETAAPLTAADVRKYDYNAVLAGRKLTDWHRTSALLRAEAEKCAQSGAPVASRVFGFLAAISLLSPEYDVSEGGSEIGIGRITSAELDLLRDIVDEVRDPDLQALIADILWIRRRSDHRAAAVAVRAYIASAARLADPELWPPAVDRLRRAVSLGARLGRNSESFAQAIAAVE